MAKKRMLYKKANPFPPSTLESLGGPSLQPLVRLHRHFSLKGSTGMELHLRVFWGGFTVAAFTYQM
jgi:hypothetical protein